MCFCVILLGVSGIAELSRPDSKVNDDGEGDDIWVELLPVQLVDTHRARFLAGIKKKMPELRVKKTQTVTWKSVTNNPHQMERLSEKHGKRLVKQTNTQNSIRNGRANFL